MNKEQQDHFKNARDRFTTEVDSFLIAYDNATRVNKPTEESELKDKFTELIKNISSHPLDYDNDINFCVEIAEQYSNTQNAALQKEVERLKAEKSITPKLYKRILDIQGVDYTEGSLWFDNSLEQINNILTNNN
jgi:hypothetical protein